MTHVIKTKAISIEAVMDIFYEQAERTDIALNSLLGGICFAKTHIICEDLISKGITPKKAWAFERPAQKLWIENHPHFTEEMQERVDWWWYHIAPALSAQDNDGNQIDLLLDPCLFDAPVTKEQWIKTLHAVPAYTFILDHEELLPQYGGNFTPEKEMNEKSYETAQEKILALESSLKANNKPMPEKRIVFESDFRKAFERAANVKLPTSGKTWERYCKIKHQQLKVGN